MRAPTPGVFQDVLGHLRGLATAGLASQQDDLVAAHSIHNPIPASQAHSGL